MRLFIAVNFNAGTKSKLVALRDELRLNSRGGNFTPAENLHLTLEFLGECDVRQADRASVAMDAVNFQPFDLEIDRTGRFKRGDGDIWWAGVVKNEPLIDLQRDLSGRLIAAGFILDKREYSPHITLGRRVITSAAPRRLEPFAQRVSNIELMKSEHIRGKLTYTAIYSKQM